MSSRGWKGVTALGVLAILALIWSGAAAAATFPKMDVKLGHSGVVDMSYHKGSVKFAELMEAVRRVAEAVGRTV